MIEEHNVVKECKSFLELTERFKSIYNDHSFDAGWFEGANYVLCIILKSIKEEQQYEDQQYMCCNDHDSIKKYDRKAHDGHYFVKEKMRIKI